MTVTGRGIWTPDDGDNFDFTVDLGAMAESIDLALGDVEDSALEEAQEGVPRRFNTLSALQAWTPADGAIAFVTSDNRYYVRVSGGWRGVEEDSGWLPLPGNRSGGATGTDYAEYRKFGPSISIRLRLTGSFPSSATNIWEGITPELSPDFEVQGPAWYAGSIPGIIYLRGSGTIATYHSGTGSPGSVHATVNYFK